MLLLQSNTTLQPEDFFTYGTFTTLAGATAVVYIVSGVVQHVFNFSPKWFALLLSILISFIGMFLTAVPEGTDEELSWTTYLIALLNGFLIYSSAIGSNQFFDKKSEEEPQMAPQQGVPGHRHFRANWWN